MQRADEKTTVPNPSAATDGEQPLFKEPDASIADFPLPDNEDFSDNFFQRINDPGFLPTYSMPELYGSIFHSKPPIIQNLLYPGTYLFAGAPKIGKSFLMAQLAFHISSGKPLWNFVVQQGTVLYLALEDNQERLQQRLYRMFGTDVAPALYFSNAAKPLGGGLDQQIETFRREHPDTNLVIIDTLQKVRESGNEKCSYASDYEIISKLKRPYVRYTRADEKNVRKADCLIIDCFGLLSSIYRYGEIAYIGGGFGVGIHNTLEAAVYGIPVIFGPKYQKFQEAVQLLEAKGGFSVKSYEELKALLDRMLEDESFLRETGTNAGTYVTGNAGATDKVLGMINF